MPELAYVNGRFCDLADATVSIEDRGFQFADSVYEVVVGYGKTVFRLEEHLDRLRRSLALIDMDIDLEGINLEGVIHEGIEEAGFSETMVYIQVTRGVQSRSHVYGDGIEPTVIATFKPKPVIDPSVRDRGISVVTVEDFRWPRCQIKAVALLPNVLAKNRALRDGFDDAIFVSSTGNIREATSANVFAVRDRTLITPSTDEPILHGVTRKYILECAGKVDLATGEMPLTVSNLESAEEAFLSSSTIDIMPVTGVNGKTVANGKPGPVTQLLYRVFLDGLGPN